MQWKRYCDWSKKIWNHEPRKMKKLNKPIYFESGFENFKIDTNESDNIEDLVGSINAVIKKYGMLLCYCTDEVKKKTLFSAWEIRPHPEK